MLQILASPNAAVDLQGLFDAVKETQKALRRARNRSDWQLKKLWRISGFRGLDSNEPMTETALICFVLLEPERSGSFLRVRLDRENLMQRLPRRHQKTVEVWRNLQNDIRRLSDARERVLRELTCAGFEELNARKHQFGDRARRKIDRLLACDPEMVYNVKKDGGALNFYWVTNSNRGHLTLGEDYVYLRFPDEPHGSQNYLRLVPGGNGRGLICQSAPNFAMNLFFNKPAALVSPQVGVNAFFA